MLIAGVDIGGTSVKMGLADERGQMIATAAVKSVHGDPGAMVASIVRGLRGFRRPFGAVGVGTAGRVDRLDGTVTASNLDWTRVPLESMLREALKSPVFVDNDAQAALMAEWQMGACRGFSDVVYLTLGTGIGGAFILDGRPYRGYANNGGEVGHIVVQSGGIPCPCGNRGCWERYASAHALKDIAAERGLDVVTFFRLALSGDPWARGRLDAYLDALCDGIISLYRLLAPQMVVLGGGLSNLGEDFLSQLSEALDRRTAPMRAWRGPALRLAQTRNDAGVLGAVALARYGMDAGDR